MRRPVLAVILVALLAGPRVGAEEDFPLPPGVEQPFAKPVEMTVGAQPMRVSVLKARQSSAELHTFYEQRLSKSGWTLQALPWMEQFQAKQGDIRRHLQEHPDDAQAAQLKALLTPDQEQKMRAAAAQQLYAVRGQEHVLVKFQEAAGQTLVTVHRWESAGGGGMPGLAADAGQTTGWPAANSCCTTEEVPSASRTLPSSIPGYPNGRLLNTAAAPAGLAGRRTTAEVYLSSDPADAVAQFYRGRMSVNGWTEVATRAKNSGRLEQMLGELAKDMTWDTLSFRGPEGLCTVVVTQYVGEGPSSAMLSELVKVTGGPAGTMPAERTVIAVNFVESTTLEQLYGGVSGHAPRRR